MTVSAHGKEEEVGWKMKMRKKIGCGCRIRRGLGELG